MRQRPGQRLLGLTSVPEPDWDGIDRPRRFGDERPYVEALAAMYPELEARFIDSAGRGFDYFEREMFAAGGVPMRNAMNLHWIHDVWREAANDGCDVVLTGSMGNMSITYDGALLCAGLLARGEFRKLFRELWSSGPALTLPNRFFGRALTPLLPRSLWKVVKILREGPLGDPFQGWCPMRREYARDMRVEERGREVGFDPLFKLPVNHREARALTFAVGAEGMAVMSGFRQIHGIETRDPTAYRPLFELCMGIPEEQFQRAGVKRFLAKRMLRGKLPDMVLREKRRGQQAADWHVRIKRQRDQLIEEIDWLKEDPAMVRRLDLDRLRQALVEMPEQTPTNNAQFETLSLAVTRGLNTARFIRYVEGRNR
jgi:asparagine synthase (glutamine-hydrolysing)